MVGMRCKIGLNRGICLGGRPNSGKSLWEIHGISRISLKLGMGQMAK